jgi:hypothetical protein
VLYPAVDRLLFCMSALSSADVLRAMEKISFEKLSEPQKFILVALMEPRYAAARPREFSAAIRRSIESRKPSKSSIPELDNFWP